MNLYACSRLVDNACLEFIQVDAVAVEGAAPVSVAVTQLTTTDYAQVIGLGFALVFLPALLAWAVSVHASIFRAGEDRL